MNYRMLGYVLGRIFMVEAALLLPPSIVAVIHGEWSCLFAFVVTAVGLAVLGLVLGLRSPANPAIYAREGLVIVALAWVLMSVFGALPFIISGDIPFFVDAFFETVSGFTTTGSSILRDVEAMSYSMLFWRSFTHWVGGMGVLVFTMVVLPVSDGRAMHLMRAESPGPSVGKISSKIRDTAKILYAMYLVLTVVQTILLRLVGLPWYDALITAFGAAGTGGFSNRAASIGAYGSPAVEMITAVFMVLFGINFNVYFFLLIRHFKEAFACETTIPDASFSVPTLAMGGTQLPGEEGAAMKICCLTFDDGPSKYTPQVLAALEKCDAKATFFVTAQDANQDYLSYLTDIEAAGHQIALHSASHSYSRIYSSTENFWLDIKALRATLANYIDVDAIHWLRFPGGSTNTVSHRYGGRQIMQQLKAQAEQKGYAWIDWNVCAEDATASHPNAAQILRNVQNDAKDQPICVVLMHDTNATHETVKALPDILEWFAAKGYHFFTVQQMAE